MEQSIKENLAVVLVGVIIAAVIGGAWYIVANNLVEAVIWAVAVFCVVVIAAYLISAFAVGTYAFVKKKDQVHTESQSTLKDSTPVEGEMNRSDEEKP